jgi:hypothetical protein
VFVFERETEAITTDAGVRVAIVVHCVSHHDRVGERDVDGCSSPVLEGSITSTEALGTGLAFRGSV